MLQSLRTCIHSFERCSIFLFHHINGSLFSFLEIHMFLISAFSLVSHCPELNLFPTSFASLLYLRFPSTSQMCFYINYFYTFVLSPFFLKLEFSFDSSFQWLNFFMKSPTVQLSLVHPKSTSLFCVRPQKLSVWIQYALYSLLPALQSSNVFKLPSCWHRHIVAATRSNQYITSDIANK